MVFTRSGLACIALFVFTALIGWVGPRTSLFSSWLSGAEQCDPGYYRAPHCYMQQLDKKKGIVVFGTSESTNSYNLGAFLGRGLGDRWSLWTIAKGGLSPIHLSLLLNADYQRSGLLGPALLLVNPVYFTKAHDGVNLSWLTSVVESQSWLLENQTKRYHEFPEDLFEMIRDRLPLAKRIFRDERYFSQFLYLIAHPKERLGLSQHRVLQQQSYEGRVVAGSYNRESNVASDWIPEDRLLKTLRWLPTAPEESLNMRALQHIARIYSERRTPLLILMLPWNSEFYDAYGLGPERWGQASGEFRERIRKLENDGYVQVIDYFDLKLSPGFKDRMHMDGYGTDQVSSHLIKEAEFRAFLRATESMQQTRVGRLDTE